MEDIVLRVPLILEKINELLDNDTLVNCMEVSFTFCAIIENQKSGRFLTTRKIQSYTKEFENDWMIVCQKLPLQKLEEFSSLVKEFYDAVPTRSEQRWSPMHIAAERGCLDFCQMIAKATPVKYSQCRNKFTPIHFAAQAGHVEVYEFLTENVNDKNPTTDRRLSPLHLAAKNGNLLKYQSICENALDINPIMKERITPLHLAAQSGHFDVCKYICDNTINVRPRRRFDRATPSRLAIPGGHMRIAKLLIENDTDIWNFNDTLQIIAVFVCLHWFIQVLALLCRACWYGVEKEMQMCNQHDAVVGWLIETLYNQNLDIFCRNMYLNYDLHTSILYTIPLYVFFLMFGFLSTSFFVWMVLVLLEKWFSYYHCPILDY